MPSLSIYAPEVLKKSVRRARDGVIRKVRGSHIAIQVSPSGERQSYRATAGAIAHARDAMDMPVTYRTDLNGRVIGVQVKTLTIK